MLISVDQSVLISVEQSVLISQYVSYWGKKEIPDPDQVVSVTQFASTQMYIYIHVTVG